MKVQRVGVIAVIVSALLCGMPATHAQVNGDATITSSFDGLPLTVGTSSQFAGAVSSIRWGNKEFINDWDHGRQLQLNSQFFNRYECYNPYEAGSEPDGKATTSSSQLLSLTAAGNTLDSSTQMAWYLPTREPRPGDGDLCGDPNDFLPVPPYTGPLSNYKVHKTVTIGFAGLPNVIEYLTELYIPEQIQKGIDNVTAVLNFEYSSVYTYDLVSKSYRNIRKLTGEDGFLKVVSTADGSYAMAFYSPEILQPYGNGSNTANFWRVVPPDPFYPDPNNPSVPDPYFACVHLGDILHYDTFNGPGYRNDRSYLVIGNLDEVGQTLNSLHFQFRYLDPDVFNWQEYVNINGLQSTLATQEQAENHWLTQGMAQGLRASRTFSASDYLNLNPDLANLFGSTNYQAAVDHYIATGRSEGRNTVAKAAAGMQHLLVFANKSVNAAGSNDDSQLGSDTPGSTSSPVQISSLNSPVTEIAAGDYTSFAVENDGSLWVWGSNQYGARGDGTSGDKIVDPIQVPIPNAITTPSLIGRHAVAVGTGAYAALDTNGQVWTWGVNWNGRLGDGTTSARYIPARVQRSSAPNDYLTGIVSIAAAGGTMIAIDADENVWTWGAGANGALGNGDTKDSSYPVQVMTLDANNAGIPLTAVSQVSCGSSGFCIALTRLGQVFGWGSNAFSQLGMAAGGNSAIAIPIAVGPADRSIDSIAAGAAHCIAHSQDGNVYAWGYNGWGQLGNGSASVAQATPLPMDNGRDNIGDIDDLSAGANFSVLVRDPDRAVYLTGDNQSGQLAIPGNQSTQYVPIRSF